MKAYDDEAAAFDEGATLLVGRSDAALERLVRAGGGPLVAVACGGRSEQLLRLASTTDVGRDVALFEVGTRTRAAAREDGPTHPPDGPAVTAVPRRDLDRIGPLVDAALEDGAAGSVYVDGEGLVSTVGVGETYGVFERLRRRHRSDGPTVCGCLPATARETTVAGVAPLFDAASAIGEDGVLRPLDRPEDGTALSVKQRLSLLEPARRRSLLRVLDDRDGRVGVDRLAEMVARRRSESPDDVRLHFYQTDLPKLDANGIVDFDRDDRTAALAPGALQLWPVLDVTD